MNIYALIFRIKKYLVKTGFVMTLAAGFIITTGSTAFSQDQDAKTHDLSKVNKELQDKRLKQVKEILGVSDQEDFFVGGAVDINSLDDRYTLFEHDQSWELSNNPNPEVNINIINSGQSVGDMNGDGLGDFLFTGFGRDERTSQLEDRVQKTIVFFGGNQSNNPDQVLYGVDLIPVGDINGDGNTDAIHSGDGAIFHGSASGYQDAGKSLAANGLFDDYGRNGNIVFGAGDLDGDGFNDVVQHGHFMEVLIYWGDGSGNEGASMTQITSDPNGTRSMHGVQYNAEDFDGDGASDLFLLGMDSNIGDENFVRVLDIGTDRSTVTELQDHNLGSFIDTWWSSLYVIDINGDGFLEVYYDSFGFERYVLTEDAASAGNYDPNAINIFNGFAVPVGDLNGDSRMDFHVGDPEARGHPYVAFGPADLTTGLGLDFDLDPNNEWIWSYNSFYTNPLWGDMDSDGVDDYVLGHTDNFDHMLGRKFVFGNTSGDPVPNNVESPKEQFIDGAFESQNVGDLNGDGIDDIAVNRASLHKVDIYFGGATISSTPDLQLDALLSWTNDDGTKGLGNVLGIKGGDFNGDGFSDVAVSDNFGIQMRIYFGGETMDATADYSLMGTDFIDDGGTISTFYLIGNMGDVNDDGIEDFLLSALLAADSTGKRTNDAYLFYGSSSGISTSPDVTISLTDVEHYVGAGYESQGLGDINGDGIDDFGISVPFEGNSVGATGKVMIFFGGSGKTFASPDLLLESPEPYVFAFGQSIVGGDFDGDGINDVAVSPGFFHSGDSYDNPAVYLYKGGTDIDDIPEASLTIPFHAFGTPGFDQHNDESIFFNFGNLDVVHDYTRDGRDELLVNSDDPFTGGNAVLFSWDSDGNTPSAIIYGPNQDAPLGGGWNSAVGDFTGNGTSEVVLTQYNDNNDAAISTRIYRYELPRPLDITSVEDVPNDQGEWVRVSVEGYFFEGLASNIYGFNHWSVWRKLDDGSWLNSATVPAYSESAHFVDVRVPRTVPTDSTPDASNQFTFKVIAYNGNDAPIAETEELTGHALDNIAPSQVQGLASQRATDAVTLSWDASNANDVDTYEVVKTDASGAVIGDPVTSVQSTSVTLNDSDFSGIYNLSVRAKDRNNNAGETAPAVDAIFPVTVDYTIAEAWNLIGLPLDISSAEFDEILSKIKDGTLYRFNGSYEKVTEVVPGQGYWAKFPASATYQLSALPVTELNLDLKAGWNLISGIGQSLDLTQIQDPNNIIIDGTLMAYDGSYVDSQNLQPGEAYWIRTNAAGTITLSATPATSAAAEDENILAKAKQQFNQIIVSDSEGHSQTLWFGSELPDAVNPLSFGLPPAAPGNTFDARIDGDLDRLSEDDFARIQIQRLPNTTVSLELKLTETYNYRSFKVKEFGSKGELLSEHEINGEDSIELGHPNTQYVEVVPTMLEGMTSSDTPDSYQLFQNYPNPFNPSTVIRYAIPQSAQVTLEVYDLLGKKVATLVNSEQQAGFHKVSFDASRLASGVYLYRLTAGAYQQTNKFILIK